jgi:hypothetical protein
VHDSKSIFVRAATCGQLTKHIFDHGRGSHPNSKSLCQHGIQHILISARGRLFRQFRGSAIKFAHAIFETKAREPGCVRGERIRFNYACTGRNVIAMNRAQPSTHPVVAGSSHPKPTFPN